MIYRIWGKSILVCWLISISCAIGVLAQDNTTTPKKIDSISFQGLKKNKESYLNQFIESKVGHYPSDSILLEDIQRLKNIPSIGNATYALTTTNQSSAIVFYIEEIRTLLPIINFGGVKNNIWFQLGFYDSNWQGNGSFLSAIYQNRDGRHGGQIYYRNERVKGKDWGFSATLNRWASVEPLFFTEGTVNYDYTNQEIGLTVIKQFGFRHQLEVGGTYFIEKYEKSATQLLENPIGPALLNQPKFLSKFEYTGNALDYHFFYLKGLFWKIALQNVYNITDKSWFHSLQLSGKYFARISPEKNLALRFQIGIATNNNSPFAPYVVDSHINLRGSGNRIARGTAQFISNIEYRVTFKESKKWGIQTVTFLDIGAWRTPGKKIDSIFNPTQFKQFLGGGLRLINKKIHGAIFRIDYGIDIRSLHNRGVVIGFGQYF